MKGKEAYVQSKPLKRIVLLIEDASTIGGIQTRTLKTIRNAEHRKVEYFCLSARGSGKVDILPELRGKCHFMADGYEKGLDIIKTWDPQDTVIWFSNKALSRFPGEIKSALEKFPLVFVGAGQLSFHVQHSRELQDRDFVRDLRVSGMMLLSNLDKLTYNQFGIYGQRVGFNPVEVREENVWSWEKNRIPTYIGRINNGTKGTDRLIPIAKNLARHSIGPLRIYTPSASVAPKELNRFLKILRDNGNEHLFDIRYDERDIDVMLSEASMLFLPSRQEAFGNVVLEAFSYGVPVVSSAHAPGPSELIDHGRTGFLIEDYDAGEIDEALSSISKMNDAKHMSKNCFDEHKKFSMERYYDLLETYSREILTSFDGRNTQQVFPYIQARPNGIRKAARLTLGMIKGRVTKAMKSLLP